MWNVGFDFKFAINILYCHQFGDTLGKGPDHHGNGEEILFDMCMAGKLPKKIQCFNRYAGFCTLPGLHEGYFH